MRRNRLAPRLVKHHLPLLVITFASVACLYTTRPYYSLRTLGTQGWKKLQRWNYAVFALAGAHALAYQGVEKQKALFVAIVILCLAITIALQATVFAKRWLAAAGRLRTGAYSGSTVSP